MIGISLLTLVPGVVGGSETYVRELTRTLAQVGKLEYEAFVPTIAPESADGLPTRVVRSYPAGWSTRARLVAMTRAAVAPRPIYRELELERFSAVHFPLSVMLPRVRRPPAVTTILDVQHELFPQNFSRAELVYRKVAYRRTARHSRIVIAISKHAKETLVERLGLEPDRVRVVYFGVDHERYRPGAVEREPFLLYPANRWPHKNHARLFEALAMIRRERPELRLVLTGSGHPATAPEGVDVLGRVSDDELADLYRRAAAVVFPSLYEGFGLPPLEAMASGCPVATSDAASLPEVCGDAAVYFDALSPESIAAGINEALARANELTKLGIARAARFTWAACAAQHEEIYRELSAGN